MVRRRLHHFGEYQGAAGPLRARLLPDDRIAPEVLRRLSGVGGASWEDRTSIKPGEALGHPLFWCRSTDDPTAVTVLVGADDETWDFAIEAPAEMLLGALPS